MRINSPVFRRAALLCALAALTLALPALADEGETAAQPQNQTTATAPASDTAVPVAAAGIIAYIDPVTGGHTTTPTDEQRAAMRAALENALSRSEEGLVEVTLPDGSVMVDLQGRFQEAVVVRIASDGTASSVCVTDAEAATTAPPAPTAEPTAVAAVE